MSIIRTLSEQTINLIAAGEVIENPASVVKELAENARDAKAKNIKIEIAGGGFAKIVVSDDGTGMGKDDAVLSIERYATSKIRSADDLLSLKTMGFRGEALASIAAISKMSITTSTGDMGVCVEVEGGKLLSVKPAPRRRGTTVEVRSLFYNVPARKKFQKGETPSASEISKAISQLSLAYPEINFNDSPFGLAERIRRILGEEFFSSMVKIDLDVASGYIGAPAFSRPNRTGQYIFINQRGVVCPAISFAVKDGYGTYIEEGRHPVFVLHFSLSEDLVDVNVHPQKKEVRLAEEGKIKEMIRSSINSSLQKKTGVSVSLPAFTPTPYPTSFSFKEEPSDFIEERLPIDDTHFVGIYYRFLIIQKEKLVFVDLHLAQKRIFYERMKKKEKPSTQRLLFPLTLPFVIEDDRLEELREMGFELHQASANSFIVDAIPDFLDEMRVSDFIQKPDQQMSCFVYKKGFMLQEGVSLYKELMKCKEPSICPEGKPIMTGLNTDEIEQLFKN